ncbi:MAG: NAD kinase [Flavobacteriaceae bacterium]
MKIALYSAFFSEETLQYVKATANYLESQGHEFSLVNRLKKHLGPKGSSYSYFEEDQKLESGFDFLFSIGGDGTILRAVTQVQDAKIPILGINTGRLGFLTALHRDALNEGLDLFFKKQYSILSRSLLQIQTKEPLSMLEECEVALNEVSVNRKNTTAMLSIHTELDGKPLTTYWSDGLIISTPTGSTGYSLSSGGPIVAPDAACWILNPIAPHNINMRPLIVPDTTTIKISVQGRSKNHLLSLDSRILTLENGNDIYLKKAPFTIETIQLHGSDFYATLREKLFWGQDKRNTQ